MCQRRRPDLGFPRSAPPGTGQQLRSAGPRGL
jgi:hypothetical protein